jgi:hypothetical protein
MKVNYQTFIETIANDYNVSSTEEIKHYFSSFPIKNGKRKINASYDAIIVDREGNKFPYMLTKSQRNADKLIDFDYISITRLKPLKVLLEEIGLILKSENCKICEGNGWYSQGTRYYYKELIYES